MFCLDVQCLIERRVDVTKLLSQNINIDELHHPVDDVWSELAVKLTKDDLTVDKDNCFTEVLCIFDSPKLKLKNNCKLKIISTKPLKV